MTPKSYFDDVWMRADVFGILHAYVSNNVAAALDPTELLRAEWAVRVSALDLYVHELVAQFSLEIFQGWRATCPGFSKLQVNSDTAMRIHVAGPGAVSNAAFSLDVRDRLSRITYQAPDEIADGIRLISPVELWNEIARHNGATGSGLKDAAKALRGSLTQIVNRRNKIVHEGDLQPGVPRMPWPITREDVDFVNVHILKVVSSIEAIVI